MNLDKGAFLWFTGFAGSGKSTVAKAVEKRLRDRGYKVENLDADEFRANVSPDLKYSKADRDLNTKLAQLQKRNLVVEDQNYLLRQRLKETSDQLAKVMQESQATEQRLQAVQASTRRRSGATITANSSLQRSLTAVTVDGLDVRQDGELVRIELPADRLFEPGTATLQPGAEAQLDRVAEVILENYSRQVVGIEAHTDGPPPPGSMWRSAHQLTAAQALAVFERIGERHRMLPQQLFVLGHGNNYPLVSSATVAGQERNRRVEIVIYPEPVGRR